VECIDVEDDQDYEAVDIMGQINFEDKVKQEISNLHDIESDTTVECIDVDDDQEKEVEDIMGKNNVEDKVKKEISNLHDIESDTTVECIDVDDDQDKEVEDIMGKNNVEDKVKEEISNLHDIESDTTMECTDVEDDQDKEVEDIMDKNNVKDKVKEEISNFHDIESDTTVECIDVEDDQDKEVEDIMGKNNMEDKVKEKISYLHDTELYFTAEHSDVEDNPYTKFGESVGDSNLEAAELKGKIDPHGIESELTLTHNNSEAIDAYSSCDNSHNMSGNRSEQEYPKQSNSFLSGDVPEFISVFAASNISTSKNNDNDGECPLFYECMTMKPIAIGAESSVSCKPCSSHYNGFGCCPNRYICDARQYHHRKENSLTEDGTGKPVRTVVEHSENEINGLTGSDVEAEKMSQLYADTKGGEIENGDNSPVGQTSSDIVARYPVSPKANLSIDGEIYLVPGHVQENVISHFMDHENILDTAQLNTKESGTHCGELDGEQREETGKQGCPIWQILQHLECPFNWVPDICIKNTPGGTIPENMIDHLTGKPTVMIQFVK
jgi:hypothetical protein